MPFKSSSQVLPPVNSNKGQSNYQTGVKNHGVSFPPIQNTNRVSSCSNSIKNGQNDYNNNERHDSRHKEADRDKNRQYNDSSRNDRRDVHDRKNSYDYSYRDNDRKHQTQRSRERNERQRSPSSNTSHDKRERRRSKSNDRNSRRRSISHDRKSRRRSSSRDRHSKRHSHSRDKRGRRRSFSRDRNDKRRSKSREQERNRGSRKTSRRQSSSNEEKKRRNKSEDRRRRSKSRDEDRRPRSRSYEKKGDRKYRNDRHDRLHVEIDRRRRSHSNEEYRYSRYNDREHRSDINKKENRNLNRSSRKITRSHRSVSCSSSNTDISRYRDNDRYSDPFRHEHRQPRERDSLRYSISNPSLRGLNYEASDSEFDEYSRHRESQRLAQSEQDVRNFVSRERKQRARQRGLPKNDHSRQKGLNIVLIDNRSVDSSSEDEDIPLPSNRTVYLRSKSNHRTKNNSRHNGYVSEMEGRHNNRNKNKIAYYDDEREEILIPVRNTLHVPRQIPQGNADNSNQSENETLFYLVPANQNQAFSERSQNNMASINQHNRRIIRLTNPPPVQASEPKQNVYYSSDSVYGQEPLYDEYRQPIQQKYFNQHTNHYRHDLTKHDNINIPAHLNQPENTRQFEDELTTTIMQTDRTPDGESSSSVSDTPSIDENISRDTDGHDTRVSTAEKRRAMKHLNELSNYNINLVRGKPHSPPMTDEALIKKVFNAEFQSELDDFLKS